MILFTIILCLAFWVGIPGAISGALCLGIGAIFKKIDSRALVFIWIVLTVAGMILFLNWSNKKDTSSSGSYKSSYSSSSYSSGSSYKKSNNSSSTKKSTSSGSSYSSSSEKSSSTTIKDDPYDKYWYDDPDDFADEWADEFDSYDDAYDYWEYGD